MITITKKYIFEQKLKGEPIKIPKSKTLWSKEIKNVSILLECGILEEGKGARGRFWVRYPVLFHGSNYDKIEDRWRTLRPGQRIAEPGDVWELLKT